jgi:sugar O-acyltransferase (sialic acid O-acetyltransferase NeuD family)
MNSKRAIIFGTASFAEVVDFYLTNDSVYEVVAFTSDDGADRPSTLHGRPHVPFEELPQRFPPGQHDVFVAVGYKKLNSVREAICAAVRARGYDLLSYICSRATIWGTPKIGDNSFIFENNTIQPFVEIGRGTILWSGNHIGHHSRIGEYCFVSSHVVVSGHCEIGSHCFLGVNSTIVDGVKVGARNLIGPAALIQHDTGDDEVYLVPRTEKHPKSSSRFMR